MRFALLSDLHFGRARPELVKPLLADIERLAPDAVLLGGDFVQRAWPAQYRQARDFLQRLPAPWIAVPGNHDLPLYNALWRLIAPRSGFRHWIAQDCEPLLETPTSVVVGIDTTNRWRVQSGWIRRHQIERVSRAIRARGDKTAIVLAHHPFHQSPEIEKNLMRGAPEALETWADAGPHVILSGHLHRWTVEPFLTRKSRTMTLQVHCGTGLSTRIRGEPNEFALIDVGTKGITVERYACIDAGGFSRQESYAYRATETGWTDAAIRPSQQD